MTAGSGPRTHVLGRTSAAVDQSQQARRRIDFTHGEADEGPAVEFPHQRPVEVGEQFFQGLAGVSRRLSDGGASYHYAGEVGALNRMMSYSAWALALW